MKPKFKYYLAGYDEIPPQAIYALEMGKGHSDVSAETIHDSGHPIPLTPTYETWIRLVQSKQKCGRCWATVRGHADLDRHNSIHHLGAPAYVPA